MQLRDVDLKLLVYLKVLLEEESVSGAARRLKLSPSAMSHALRRIRDLFDDQVLVSGEGGMRRTARMDAIFDKLERLSQLTAEVLRPLDNPLISEIEGPLILLASEDFHRVYGPGLHNGLRARGFAAPIHQRRLRRPGLPARLEASPMAFAAMPTAFAPERLVQRKLMSQTHGCIARAGHPILSGTPGIEEYLAYGHVLVRPYDWETPSPVDLDFDLKTKLRRIEVETTSFAAAAEIVRYSDCLLTVPLDFTTRLQPQDAFAVFDCPLDLPQRDLSLVWHERHGQDGRSRTVREAIVEIILENPDGQMAAV